MATQLKQSEKSPIAAALDRAANRDLRIAREQGSVLICQTLLGTLQLDYSHVTRRYTLTQCGRIENGNIIEPVTLHENAPARLIQAKLFQCYDIVEEA